MKILIIAPELYPVPNHKGTSVENCIYNISKHLAKRHSVTVISRRSGQLPQISQRGNLKILRVPGGSRSKYLTNVLKKIKAKSFDHIQIENRPSFLKKVRACFPQTPITLFAHSLSYMTPPLASKRSVNTQLRYANSIVVNSHSLKQNLSSIYPAHKEKMKVVHLGVDLEHFRPPSTAEREKVRARYKAQGSFAIVYAGRFIPIKGIPQLIKAAELVHKKIPNTKLYLAGGGNNRAYVATIKRLATKARVPVQLLGYVSRKGMNKVYWLADCFVCPTQGHEAFGLVVAEALASGAPTIASRNGGITEIIQHNQNGILVSDYKNPQAFAREIIKLAKNKSLAARLASNGRTSCQKQFHWQKTSEKLERLYRGEM